MFDWIFGDGGKAQRQQQSAMEQAQRQQDIANHMANFMNTSRDRFRDVGDDEWDAYKQGYLNQQSAANKSFDQTKQSYDDYQKKNRYNYFGNGILGSLLNPIGQTATAIGELATGNYKDRDPISDIGAAGEALFTLLPGAGTVLKGAKAAGIAGKLGKVGSFIERVGNPASIPGMALNGAALGALGELRENGNQANFGDVIGGAGSGAVFGGGIGAGMKYGGRALGNVMNNGGLKGAMSRLNGSKLKKAALIGGGLYGGSQLLGMGGEQPQPVGGYGGDNSGDEINQLAQAYAQQYGSMPTQDELAQMLQGGYY